MSDGDSRTAETCRRIARVWPLALCGLLLVAACVRFETLAQRPLWFDEKFDLGVVGSANSVAEVWSFGERDYGRHPPLHYVISYWARDVAGPRIALRAPSAFFGVFYVGVLASLGRMLFGLRAGLLAGLMAALSVYHVNYSQGGRAYSLVALLAVSQAWLFYAVLRHRRYRDLLAFVVCGAASLYTHHIGFATQAFLGVIALAVTGTAWRQRWRAVAGDDAAVEEARRALLASGSLLLGLCAVGLLYIPNLGQLAIFLTAPEQAAAQHTLGLSPRLLYDVAARWGSGDGVVAVLFLVLFLVGSARVLALRDSRLGLLLWFASPFMLYAWIPFSKFFSIRYAIPAMPAFTLLCAAGAVAIADSFGRALERHRADWPARRGAAVLLTAIAGGILAAQLSAYAVFRTTIERCSTFHRDAFVLRINDGFCERFIVLNSLNPNQAYLLRNIREPVE